jgi:hypothetical protein
MDNYQRQLNFIFNRLAENSDFWEEGIFDEQDPMSGFVFIETLLQNPAADLANYSDDQVAFGLDFIFNGNFSDLAHNFKRAVVPVERKVLALENLFHLFRDVFNLRCQAEISATPEPAVSKLNAVCYMFWDVTPLSGWIVPDEADLSAHMMFGMQELLDSGFAEEYGLSEEVLNGIMQQIKPPQGDRMLKTSEQIFEDMMAQYKNLPDDVAVYYQAIAAVMRQCLTLENPACVESGLHGLGHMVPFLPDLAVPIIDEYLEHVKTRSESLIHYAKAARTGMIQ